MAGARRRVRCVWSSGHLDLEGGTSIPLKDLARVEVDVVNGHTLIAIPV